jgi:hypothetical protein
MTENKLRKFTSKPREPPSGKRTHQPKILTDSKGIYLTKNMPATMLKNK